MVSEAIVSSWGCVCREFCPLPLGCRSSERNFVCGIRYGGRGLTDAAEKLSHSTSHVNLDTY